MNLVDGRYRIERELGRGGMGVVYRARDVNLGRDIALKLIAPELIKEELVVSSFQREAQALARVRSQHVVQIFSFGQHESSFFFAMEFIEGVSLSHVIDEHAENEAAIPLARGLTLLRQLGSGLDAVHAAGTVHRDVKPDNVLIEHGSGRPILIDFGLAIFAQSGSSNFVAGTPEYVSPEQIKGGADITPRADLYAFATMAFEMLSGGHLPFKASSAAEFFKKHVYEPPRTLSSVRPTLPRLDEVFDRALAKDPAARFGSCREMVAALQARLDREELRWSIAPRTSQPPEEPLFDVLVIDTDPTFAKLAARAAAITFHGTPSHVSVAETADGALPPSREHPPRLLLINEDIADGLETIAKLRALPRGSEMRVVVVSREPDKERWRFDVLGVEDFIEKPVTLPSLLKALEGLAARAGWRRAAVPRRDPSMPPPSQ